MPSWGHQFRLWCRCVRHQLEGHGLVVQLVQHRQLGARDGVVISARGINNACSEEAYLLNIPRTQLCRTTLSLTLPGHRCRRRREQRQRRARRGMPRAWQTRAAPGPIVTFLKVPRGPRLRSLARLLIIMLILLKTRHFRAWLSGG